MRLCAQLIVVSSVLLHCLLTSAAVVGPRKLRCLNDTHWQRCDSTGTCDEGVCRFGFTCIGTSCRGATLSDHLPRAADYQIVLSVPSSQLDVCSASHADDVAAGRMLCDVWHATTAAQPTFGHILGNTWLHFGYGPGANAAPCNLSAAAWRGCFGTNIKAIVAALQAESPELLFSGGLMEFLDSANLDDSAAFPTSVCRPRSQGQWGGNTTCIPDVTLAAAQAYYIAWGRIFLDAGIRAIFFGQARLTGGTSPDGTDDVDPSGAAGFAAVITALRDYARASNYGDVYFGPQAAAAITLANGSNIADWVYGAQHLEPHFGSDGRLRFLSQPTLRNGSYISSAEAQYGSGDFHDASRSNARGRGADGPAVKCVLDYDNYSGDSGVYDDIRRLASAPDGAALVRNHYRYIRAYSDGAVVVTVPFSKWLAVPTECRCYANMSEPIWGAGSIYFSAFACGILDTAVTLWSDPDVSPLDGGIDGAHFGQQLQGAGDTAVHVLKVALNRSFAGRDDYNRAVAALPPRLNGAAGPRCALVTATLMSSAFNTTTCPATLGPLPRAICIVEVAHRSLLLTAPSADDIATIAPAMAAGNFTISDVTNLFSARADAVGLYNRTDAPATALEMQQNVGGPLMQVSLLA